MFVWSVASSKDVVGGIAWRPFDTTPFCCLVNNRVCVHVCVHVIKIIFSTKSEWFISDNMFFIFFIPLPRGGHESLVVFAYFCRCSGLSREGHRTLHPFSRSLRPEMNRKRSS